MDHDVLIRLCLTSDRGARPRNLTGDRRRLALRGLLQTTLDEPDERGGGRRTGLGSHVSLYFSHNLKFDLDSPKFVIAF